MEIYSFGFKMCDDSQAGPFLAQYSDGEIKGRNFYESFGKNVVNIYLWEFESQCLAWV